MKRIPFRLAAAVSLVVGFVVALSSRSVFAQTASQALPQITQRVSDSQRYELKGHVTPLAQAKYDQGAVPDATPTGRLIMTLKRPAAQENALQKFLAAAHTKGSANYHQWLTPTQFGQQFGPADSDIAAVQSWLQSHGFTVEKIGAGKSVIEYSGTAGQIKEAFHTELHTFNVKGVIHHSNASNPKIPAALAPVIAGIGQMNDFHPQPMLHVLGQADYDPKTHKVTPLWTIPQPGGVTYYGVGAKDLETQYNFAPVYSAGLTGAGQTVGIINDSNIDLGLVSAYRKLYELDGTSTTPNLPTIIIDGSDPGINGDSNEAYLDVEMIAATAPQANVLLYIGANTDYADGLVLAMLRAVDDDTAPVLSMSFGGCEAGQGADGEASINTLWEQAAAQGQTVMVSSGDSASAGCDLSGSMFADNGLQVNGLGDTPWNVSVGGTDFYYSDYATGGASAANAWSTTNDAQLGSLIAPLPEQPWNDGLYGLNAYIQGFQIVSGGGGGQSTCAVEGGPLAGTNVMTSQGYCLADDGNPLGGYPKPSWQTGLGVPNDLVRDVPDVSLFAADGANYSFHAVCITAGDCGDTIPTGGSSHITAVGGTSAAAPAFAGMMTLVNQKYGRQGQANYVLYALAQKVPSVFHDVTVGSNNAPCSIEIDGSLGCSDDPDGSGNESLQNWYATPGYDLATGLGSVDVNALIKNWNSVAASTATTTTFAATPATITHGQSSKLTATVTTSGSGTPTGNVAVLATTTLPANVGQTFIPLSNTGTGTINYGSLPGGTYNLFGRYSGDATFTSSESTPVSITVTPENSILAASMTQTIDGGSAPAPLPSGTTFPYGSQIGFDVQVEGAAGTIDGTATGTITYSDNGQPIATYPVNVGSASAYISSTWAVGAHSLTASYSGDPSYNPSKTTSPLTFTVTKGTTTIDPQVANSTVQPNGTATILVQVQGDAVTGAVQPTGNITLQYGSQTVTASLVPFNALGFFPTSQAAIVLPNLAPGTYPLSATYNGDSNWLGSTGTDVPLVVSGPATLLNSNTTLVITSPTNLATIQPGTIVTMLATVTGPAGSTIAPTGQVDFVFNDGVLVPGTNGDNPVTLVPGSGATSTATLTLAAGTALSGANDLLAIYAGDSNYVISYSNQVAFNNPVGDDFSLLNNTPTVSVVSGSPGTASLTLNSLGGFSGAVSLTCTVAGGPSGNTLLPTCTIPASETVSNSGQTPFTVQIATTATTVGQTSSPHGRLGSEGVVLACLFLIITPLRRRGWKQFLSLTIFIGLAAGTIIGCSKNGGSASTTTIPTVPAGTYVAVITGTSTGSGTTHNVALSIVVTGSTK